MNLKLLMSMGTVAAGLMCSGGNAQALDSPQNMTPSQPLEIAQSAGSGSTSGNTGGGTTSGGLGSGNASGMASGNTGSSNMNTGKSRQGGETSMGI